MLSRHGSVTGGGGFQMPVAGNNNCFGGQVPPEARGQLPYAPFQSGMGAPYAGIQQQQHPAYQPHPQQPHPVQGYPPPQHQPGYGPHQGYGPPQPGYPPPHPGYHPQQQGYHPQQPGYQAYPQAQNYPPPVVQPQPSYPGPQAGYPGPGQPQTGYPPGQPASQSQKQQQNRVRGVYQLSISARNLKDKDTFSKSDPYCVLYSRTGGRGGWKKVGRTETIQNDLYPVWQKKLVLEHPGESAPPVQLKFEIFDEDMVSDDKLGKVETTVDALVRAPGMRFQETVKYGSFRKNGGTLLVSAQKLQ